ncbi:645_t:CDS:2, partial [Cetraspora pellucida]
EKQCQKDFANINGTWSALDCIVYTSTMKADISFKIFNHFDAVIGIICDCPYYIISLYNNKKTDIFKEPNHDLIHAELSVLRSKDLSTTIKGHREWSKIADCYTLNLSSAIETYIEVKYQRCLSAKYFSMILCSLIASTDATLELISAEDTEKVNRNKISHTIKNIEKKIKSLDAESIANALDISTNKAKILKQNPEYFFVNNMTLQYHYLWRTYASGDI